MLHVSHNTEQLFVTGFLLVKHKDSSENLWTTKREFYPKLGSILQKLIRTSYTFCLQTVLIKKPWT